MKSLFGTDGIRARVGETPFTPATLMHLGYAIATWADEKYGPHSSFIIAHDTRTSCSWIKSLLKAGMLHKGVHIYDAHTLPTPGVFHLLKTMNTCVGALVISASHNQYRDNGIKIIDAQRGKISLADEQRISELMHTAILEDNTFTYFGYDTPLPDASHRYANELIQLFPEHMLAGIKVVLDTAHGAASYIAPEIFRSLGAEVITINNQPNGTNINDQCGSLHPHSLQEAVIAHKAAIGFAFDGDADRVIAVTRTGICKDGDDIIALLATHHPTYQNTSSIVGTVMTNHGLHAYLKEHNKQLIRTPVGDKYVHERLDEDKLILGGEQSGHIILNDVINTADGTLVALKIMEALILSSNWDFVTFKKYPQLLLNIPVKRKGDLNSSPLAEIIAIGKEELVNGRILVRYSGTENYLRIMVEDENQELISHVAHSLAHQIQKFLE